MRPLDPVRYLGNRSSGRQGYALARVAAQRGASVTLVAAHTADLGDPAAVDVVRAGSARELREAMLAAAKGADAVVMAAAVADFRPTAFAANKIKKGSADPEPLALTRNPDILVELAGTREPGQVIVGFAAETGDDTGDALHHGRAKLARKGCDLLVVNAVGDGRAFEVPDNAGWLLGADGSEVELPSGSKASAGVPGVGRRRRTTAYRLNRPGQRSRPATSWPPRRGAPGRSGSLPESGRSPASPSLEPRSPAASSLGARSLDELLADSLAEELLSDESAAGSPLRSAAGVAGAGACRP